MLLMILKRFLSNSFHQLIAYIPCACAIMWHYTYTFTLTEETSGPCLNTTEQFFEILLNQTTTATSKQQQAINYGELAENIKRIMQSQAANIE